MDLQKVYVSRKPDLIEQKQAHCRTQSMKTFLMERKGTEWVSEHILVSCNVMATKDTEPYQ